MYKYPISNYDVFNNLLDIIPSDHSMDESLMKYMEMKIHPQIEKENYKKIVVQGLYDRTDGISSKEKTGKLFNYIRPTSDKKGDTLYINCFPGIDYVFHYGNIIKTYLSLKHKNVSMVHLLPTEEECWHAICKSNLENIPEVHTVILGYVEGIQDISPNKDWNGEGDFLWKSIKLASSDGILLGCKHTYWGDISGRLVGMLASRGVKRIIYVGKLGTLNPDLVPNITIATGNSSILPNGDVVEWDNIFSNINDPQVYYGKHITVPSVMQETKDWLNQNKKRYDFVDPEIGHMALSAKNSKIQFSYLHIISDNLSKKFNEDLSNERKEEVITNRKKLCKKIEKILLSI